METEATYHLLLFGAPSAVHKSSPQWTIAKPKRTVMWCLLLRLLNGDALTRSELITQLKIEDENLTQALRACRLNFGEDCLQEIGAKRLRLRTERFSSDWQEFCALFTRAQIAASAEQIALYHKAFALVTGTLLARCSDRNTEWVRKQEETIAAVGLALIPHAEQQGDSKAACELAGRLATYLPCDADVTAAFKRVNVTRRVSTKTRADAQLEVYTRELERKGETLNLRNPHHREQFLYREYAQVEAYCLLLRRLSVFDGSFDAELAHAVFAVTSDQLHELTTRVLLLETDGRLEMPEFLRDWLRSKISPSQFTALRTAYHSRTIAAFRSGMVNDWHVTPELHALWTPNLHHLDAAIGYIVNAPALPPELSFERVDIPCVQGAIQCLPQRVPEVYAFVMRQLAPEDTPPIARSWMHRLCGRLAASRNDFEAATDHYFHCLELMSDDKTAMLEYYTVLNYLTSLHHGGRVAEAVTRAEAWIGKMREHNNPKPLCGLLRQYADSLLALGRFEEAYRANSEALSLAFQLDPPVPLAPLWYDQGRASAGMGYDEEAIQAFDEALALFEAFPDVHGQADCLQQIGKLQAKQGRLNFGKRAIEDALKLYASLGKEHSRAGCLRTLGDVLKIKGDFAGAGAAYCEGLAFWEEQQHPNWTALFRERLHSLSEQNDLGENGVS